ncbi:MAG: alanine dehydrogenase, partial [Actinobacteria bacterium]
MIVGVPKEIKNNEFRVGLTPGSVREFVHHGHTVFVERNAGEGSSFADAEYIAAGASILDTAEEVFAKSEMIVKVKEPQAVEIAMLRPGQILYT